MRDRFFYVCKIHKKGIRDLYKYQQDYIDFCIDSALYGHTNFRPRDQSYLTRIMKQFEPGTFIKTQLVQYVSHDLQTRWQKDDESAAASSRLMHSVIHARMILEFMNRSESLLTRTANLLRCALSDPVELLACILLLRIRGGELDAERYEFYVYQTFKHWQQVIRQLQQDLEKMPVTVEYLPLGRLFQLTPVQDKLCFWLDLNLVSDLRRIQPAKIFCILGEGGRVQLERFERLLTDGFLKEDD